MSYDLLDYKLPEKEAWDMISWMDWHVLSTQVHTVDKNLFHIKMLREFGRDKCQLLYDFQKRKTDAMDQVFRTYRLKNDFNTSYSGDDGYYDLRSHIVGLGMELFVVHIINPEFILTRWCKKDYVENFSYWIPQLTTEVVVPNSSKFINGEEYL